MINLKNTKIKRAGATSRQWSSESIPFECEVLPQKETLEFSFSIASKGGGKTEILLSIGKEDLPEILNEVSEKMPSAINIVPKFVASNK